MNYLSFFFSLKVFFVMSCCTSDVGLQVLPFINHTHLGSILCFQRFSCIKMLTIYLYIPQKAEVDVKFIQNVANA